MHTFGTLSLLLLVLIGIASAKQLIDSRIGEESVSSCRETSVSGVVTIKLNESVSFQAVCVQRHRQFGDGWMVIQQRTDFMLFYQNWAAYRKGFGDFDRSFWLGLEKVYQVTERAPHELVVEYQPVSGPRLYSQVASFGIGSESEKYALKKLDSYSGTARDCITASKGADFSTFDEDNNINGDSNCAVTSQGAWWYTSDWYVVGDCTTGYHQ
ncbi:ficolin-1 [Culex quinquefasciatus]|uniref:Ficolin-1 n=1 Tax=Culex quinquefasciatus TaxID=7176 RepID=B0WS97_CULQU|nr:ficolin-1 [Culex quinquefasciatus]|eukprot:XP_001851581.1 ficolin-1 [Culex quinquefasciatus]